ncbi:MAG TPA: hypothetical protein GXX55_03530 [Firmicutes bacterium]|nr:hypothetical protein [Bacillota bacterium]
MNLTLTRLSESEAARKLGRHRQLEPEDCLFLFAPATGRGITVVFGVEEAADLADGLDYRYLFEAATPSRLTGGRPALCFTLTTQSPRRSVRLLFPPDAVPLLLQSDFLLLLAADAATCEALTSVSDLVSLSRRGFISVDLREDEDLRILGAAVAAADSLTRGFQG